MDGDVKKKIKNIPFYFGILPIIVVICFILTFSVTRLEIENNRRIVDKLQKLSISGLRSGNLTVHVFHQVLRTFQKIRKHYLWHFHKQVCRRRYKTSLYDKKITMMGDSTARPIAEALTNALGCDIVQSEDSPDGWMPDRNYFSLGGHIPDVVVEIRKCHKCTGFIAFCNKYNLQLEYWSMFVIGDTSVHLVNSTGSSLDFLFETWWNLTGPPDVIFDMASTTHSIVTYPKEKYPNVSHQYFKEMSEYVLQRNISYFWSTSPKVWETLVPDEWQNVTSNTNIQTYNEIANSSLYAIQNQMDESKRWLHFGLDLFEMSSSLTRADYLDAVHHIEIWNARIGFKLLRLYCRWWSLH